MSGPPCGTSDTVRSTATPSPLRVAQVVTLLSADGSYGGPVSVAVGQCVQLVGRGHEVTLLSGWDGQEAPPPGVIFHGFRVRQLLPGGGFGTVSALLLAIHLGRRASEFDVVHLHLARNFVMIPAALACLWRGIPFVVQTHGMVVPDPRLRSRIFDGIAIRRILRKSWAQLVLTGGEWQQVLDVAPNRDNIVMLSNGIATSGSRAHPAGAVRPEVLFCARLHPRKRVLAFADMASALIARGVRARFTVIGPDEGDLPALNSRMADPALAGLLSYEGPLAPAAVHDRLAAAQVFVLPSEDEPFPMTVLEAWSSGLPTVITESNGLAQALAQEDRSLVVSGSVESLADAVEQLIVDEDAWRAASARVLAMVTGRFGITDVVASLEVTYRSAIAADRSSTRLADQELDMMVEPSGLR